MQTGGHHPCGQIRTPLGLVEEPETCAGCYSVLWTGYSTSKGTDANGFTPVCHAVIKQVNERAALKTEDGDLHEGESGDQPPIDQPPFRPKYCQQGENDRLQTTRLAGLRAHTEALGAADTPGHGHGEEDKELGCSLNGQCMHGGTPPGYYCRCDDGWTGRACEQCAPTAQPRWPFFTSARTLMRLSA